MNPEPDHDLRSYFAALRKADRVEAPAWNPHHFRQSTASALPFGLPKRIMIPLAAAACLSLSFVMMHQKEQSDLTKALPALFDTPTEPLFASLEDASAPSDFLLPTYLSIYLP